VPCEFDQFLAGRQDVTFNCRDPRTFMGGVVIAAALASTTAS
jgi:hypothetical protein